MNLGSLQAITHTAQIFETLISFFLATFISLGLYNFFIFTQTRDRAYFYYSLRCVAISVLCTVATNYAAKYFVPTLQYDFQSIPPWLSAVNMIIWIGIARNFLSLDTFVPRKFLLGSIVFLIVGQSLGILYQMFNPSSDPCVLLKIFNPLCLLANITAGIYVIFKGYRPAFFYVPANIIYFAGVFVMILSVEGVIASTTYLYLAPMCAGAIEAILMSFGLGDKYMSIMKSANFDLNRRNDELGRDISGMLHNLKQGIFSIGPDAKIGEDHSEHLRNLFETPILTGRDGFDLIFRNSNITPDRVSQVKNATMAGFGQGIVNFEMNEHIFPRELIIHSLNGQKILEVDWQPLLNHEQLCDKMMIVLRDVTELRNMQEQSEKNQKDLQIVGQVLAISTRAYEKFSQNADLLIAENFRLIADGKVSGVTDIPRMFRNVHTIKGNARTFGLLYISNVSHEVEEYFSEIRANKTLAVNYERLTLDLMNLRNMLTKYDQVLAGLLAVAIKDSPEDLIHRLNQLHEDHSDINEVKERFFKIAEEQMVKRFYSTLEEMLVPVLQNQKHIAEELHKPTPKIIFHGSEVTLKVEVENVFRNIFTQLFRNSIDHGIEKPFDRQLEGKDSIGVVSIEIDTTVSNEDLTIEVRDDGAGLAIDELAKKCSSPNMSDQDIGETIFLTGVSTATHVTHISGRGVGMDIVKHLVLKHNGSISIVFTGPKTAAGRRPFKFILTFPASIVHSS